MAVLPMLGWNGAQIRNLALAVEIGMVARNVNLRRAA
jgi:hypothetical protein